MNRTYLPLALAAAIAFPAVASAADSARTPRIVVTGEGEASVAPDIALQVVSGTSPEVRRSRVVNAC